jgi:hypothetical protein
MVGTHAQRPPIPNREGHGWFSRDIGRLFIGDHLNQWREIEVETEAFFLAPNPMIRVAKRTNPQTIETSTAVPIQFAGGDVDYEEHGDFFNPATSQTDFIIPETGRYIVTARAQYDIRDALSGNSNGLLLLSVNCNIVSSGLGRQDSNATRHMVISTQVALQQGDVVRLLAQYEGTFTGSYDIILGAGELTGLEMARIDRVAVGTQPTPPAEDPPEITNVRHFAEVLSECPEYDNFTVSYEASDILPGDEVRISALVGGGAPQILETIPMLSSDTREYTWGAREDEYEDPTDVRVRVEAIRGGLVVAFEDSTPSSHNIEIPATCPGDFQ